MSVTHGGRARRFRWCYANENLRIENESGLRHTFSLAEVHSILGDLRSEFGEQWFPLANNVEKMYHGTEVPGLGTAIYRLCAGDTFHAQGASYLGVVLE